MKRVLIYNPTCEMAVQNNNVSYQPPIRLQEFEKAMTSLMMFVAQKGDSIVGERPDDMLMDFWREQGLFDVRYIKREEALRMVDAGAELVPWGGSRQLYYSYGLKDKANMYTEEMRNILSRRSSVLLEQKVTEVCARKGQEYFKYTVDDKAVELTTSEAMEERVRKGMCAVKSLWSSSGRGVQLVRESQHIEPAITWARGKIRHDGGVICEPFYRRRGEFTTLCKLFADGKVVYLGTNYFEADEAGRFGKELIGQKILTEEEQTCVAKILTEALAEMQWNKSYEGMVGVDGMIYEDDRGERRVRCCTEVNIRYTMGNVNLSVSRFFADGVKAEWRIEQFASSAAWAKHCKEMSERYPLVVDEKGKIKSGFFRLSSLEYAYGAWGLVI